MRLQRVFVIVVSVGALLLGSRAATSEAQGSFPTLPTAVPVCPGPAALGTARCHSWVRTDAGAKPTAAGTPAGYAPSDLRSAYNLSTKSASSGSGATVAIVDAYDDPTAAADLAVYRCTFGLPAMQGLPSVTVGNTSCSAPSSGPSFRKVNQNGLAGSYPSGNTGWAEEISLDVDMVSAICPNCNILLVEADSNSFANLATAVNTAASFKPAAISNSYGGREFSSEGSATYDGPFNHSGIAITVSSGDSGYGVEFPAASQYVTAVGGTSLTRASTTSRGWAETVWSGAGSGCSAYISKPSWQTDTGCSRRTVADVAADADPNTGVAVYDTYGEPGWLVFGGTSVAAPIIASVYALAGNTSSITYGAYPYSHTGSLNDVTSGKNTHGPCRYGYLCQGVSGYDGPTGNGTPNVTGAF